VNYAVLIALSIFFGFAFEEFYSDVTPAVPGGVRTFPLLTLAGTALYLVEPHLALAFLGGLAVLGWWIATYIRVALTGGQPPIDGPLIVPTSALIAYVLGPIALTQPLWMPVALVVGAVLFIGAKKPLHDLVANVPKAEIFTLAQFLLLVGVALPLLYGAPAIPGTTITPFSVWLALVAVSTLSYASYLLQRYALPQGGVLVTAALGGLYSSTATTVVLARAAHDEGVTPEITAGVVAATAMMYLRMIVIIAVFDLELARALFVPLLVLAVVAAIVAAVLARRSTGTKVTVSRENPLRLGTALIFAVLLIVISEVSKWVQAHAGAHGVLALAAVVGVTDIDPFVLSLAQGGAANVGLAVSAVAIVVAASSNNLLKAGYVLAFARRREAALPAGILAGLSLLGLIAALFMPR